MTVVLQRYAAVVAVLLAAVNQTWENDDQPLLDFAELAVLLSAISAAFVCESWVWGLGVWSLYLPQSAWWRKYRQ